MNRAWPNLGPLGATLALVGAFTAVRLLTLFVTPLELYPDEAQYWLWSRTLDWGYYSKPPMVAWLIALSTAIGGDDEPWVRLSALWLHAGAALALYATGRRLYGGWAGFWAAALYSLMPGVQLSSGVVTTDAPLLFFLCLALLAYVEMQSRRSPWLAFAFGAAVGAAALSKYAAVYFLLGAALHLLLTSKRAESAVVIRRVAAAAAGLALVLGPNLAWNAAHGFATVSHTAANADWSAADRFNPEELADFIGAQFGVFGPLPFAVLLGGAAWLGFRRRFEPADALLLCFVAPPLLIVAGQAFITRANANWAAAAYAPASVLVAGWLCRWRARRTQAAVLATQGALAALFFLAAGSPAVADALGLANAFKRARGWSDTTAVVLERMRREPGLTAVAVDDRFYFNALAYYGRDAWRAEDAPPLRMWVREASPQNQAETTAPLRPGEGARVLAISSVGDFRRELKADFARTSSARDDAVRLDSQRERVFQLFIGEGFSPRPRDPETGLPVLSGPTPP